MRRIIFIIISTLLLFACGHKREADSKFNLDFEQIENSLPVGWETLGESSNYRISIDSTTVKSGKYSAVIEFKGDIVNFKVLSLTLPNYNGKQITLSGYIKTENVTDGYAGLWMRIDPSIASDNMYQREVTGITDWTKYEITLPLAPPITEQITLGGLFNGKGKVWFDNLEITVDGKDIQKLKPYKKKPFPAEKDHQFDKGSNIVFPELNDQKTVNLELLGRIWGFLKYHHPAIGKGKYNWDYELFRVLPEYLKANDNDERDKVLLNWINKYGNIPGCKTCQETPEDAFIKPDLSWIDNGNMNQKLKSLLHKVYLNRHQGYHYYIRMAARVENPVFMNENAYSEMPYPDAGFRLLALYRYWNMIYYFDPTKYLTDKDWNKVLKEYVPLLVNAKNELEYELAATQIIGEVCDTHAGLWDGGDKIDSLRGNWVPPFRVQFIENQLTVTEYYSPNLKELDSPEIGDIITHINGKKIEFIIDSIKKYYPASNEAAKMRDIAKDLLRSNGNTIHISFISSNRIKQKEVMLYGRNHFYRNNNPKCYKLLDGNIGYITLKSIKSEDIPKIKETLKNTRGIIIDIRNYPAAFVPFTLGSYFISSSTPFVKFTNGNTENPGEFTFTPTIEIPKPKETYKGKLIVIVNEETQSQAEYTAMAFRAGDNTTIIGSQTAGADGNVSEIVLPGGLKTWISGIGVYYPDGGETQRIGIVPDIEVKPTIKGIREGRDEVLEKAIEIIEKDRKAKKH